MLKLLAIAICPRLGLSHCLRNWSNIARALRERPRKRPLEHEIVLRILQRQRES
jgi:hypothetical protein